MTQVAEGRLEQPDVEGPSGPGPARSPIRTRLFGRPAGSAAVLRWWALACVGLVATTGASLGAFHTAVQDQPSAQRYSVTTAAAQRVSVPGSGPTAWFGTSVNLTKDVSTATLWVQASQLFQVWVNGRRGPTNVAEVRMSAPPSLHAIDVLPGLRLGQNGIVLRITNADGGQPSVLARLVVNYSDGSRYLSQTGDAAWVATSDASKVGAGLPLPPGAAPQLVGQAQLLPAGPGPDWSPPQNVPSLAGVGSAVPQWAMERPMSVLVIGGPAAGFQQDVALSTQVRLPADPTDGWLRVAATGSFEVVLDGVSLGKVELDPVGSIGHPRTRLYLFDVGRLLHSGDNQLIVHVHGQDPAAAAVDGIFSTPAGQVAVASGPNWLATSRAVASGLSSSLVAPATVVQPVPQMWPSGLVRTLVPSVASTDQVFNMAFAALACLLGWMLLGLATSRFAAVPLTAAARLLAVAAAPTLALTVLALAVATWTSRSGGFPMTTSAQWVIGLVLVGSWALAVAGLATARPRPRPGDDSPDGGSVPAPPDAAAVRRPLAALRRLGWSTWAVVATSFGATGIQAYQLGHEPLWQDEVTSLIAAQSIRLHGAPVLPSGLTYFKGELYHGVLALATSITTNVTALRSISLGWFLGTVLLFGLLLMPTLAPGRRVVQVAATVVFALAPAEVVWARDIRMYQQMQFFAVLFIALIIRALRTNSRRSVIGSALALLAMYLSHEESFVVLPAIPVLLALGWRSGWWRRPVWLVSYGLVAIAIGAQFALTKIHPPSFGQDLSNRAYVGWDPQQGTFYYSHVFFRALGTGSLALMSTLALVAALVALVRRDQARILASAALLVTVISMSLLFTAKVERYAFVVLPLLFALGMLGAADVVAGLERLAGGSGVSAVRSWASGRAFAAATGALMVVAVVASMAQSPGDFSLLAARVTATTTVYKHVDYQHAAQFIARNQRPGDAVVTLAPADVPAYYLGRTPDAVIQTGRNKLLYLIERDGQATDTIFGARSILTGSELDAYLSAHLRVWLVSDMGGYLQSIPTDLRTSVLSHFRLVYVGSGSTVWLWSP